MAEYLSPGVYVEEFESGGKPMEGVSTSTAGFIGLAERGPVEGLPQLVTSFADFKRKYGSYLSENEYGEYRFLAYAVEHFFINGGARCFISRVAPKDSKCAVGYAPTEDTAVMKLMAKNPGKWGDSIRAVIIPSSKAKTQVLEVIEGVEGKQYKVKNSAGFNPGDVVSFTNKKTIVYNRVVKSHDNILEFEEEFTEDIVDTGLLPVKTLTTCEFNMEVKFDDQVELFENVSFNIEASNFITKKTAKSDLIVVEYMGTSSETILSPFAEICGDAEEALFTVSLLHGSNGSVANISAADYIGEIGRAHV